MLDAASRKLATKSSRNCFFIKLELVGFIVGFRRYFVLIHAYFFFLPFMNLYALNGLILNIIFDQIRHISIYKICVISEMKISD